MKYFIVLAISVGLVSCKVFRPSSRDRELFTLTTTTKLDIHQKYQSFDKEVWETYFHRYFRPDGQHIDRWQVEGGPEVWHIPDGPVFQGLMLGAYSMNWFWRNESGLSTQKTEKKLRFLMKGFETLEKVTGQPGLLARVAIRTKDEHGKQKKIPDWVWSLPYRKSDPKNGLKDYIYRFDVSGDQYSGVAWGLSAAMRFGPRFLKVWAKSFAQRILRYLHRNDWRLKVNGQVTEHGNTAPTDPAVIFPNCLHVTKIMAFARIANIFGTPAKDTKEIEDDFRSKWYEKCKAPVFRRLSYFVGCGKYKKSDNVFQVSSVLQAIILMVPQDRDYRKIFKDFLVPCHYKEKNAYDDFALLGLANDLVDPDDRKSIHESALSSLREFPYPKVARGTPSNRYDIESKVVPVHSQVINSWVWGENPYVRGKIPTGRANDLLERFSPVDYLVGYNMGRALKTWHQGKTYPLLDEQSR